MALTEPLPPRSRWAVTGPLLAALFLAALMTWVKPETGDTLGGLGMTLGFVTAGVLAIWRSRNLEQKEKRAWRFLAVGMFLVATGVIVVGVLTELGVELKAFGVTDVFFLGGYTMLLVVLYRLARADGDGRSWLPTILDALVGAIALSALVWTSFYRELIESFGSAPTWEKLIAMTYPVVDIAAVIGLMILVIRRSHFRLDLRLIFLASGLSVQIVADFVFLHSGVGRSFVEAKPSFGLLLVATMCYLVSTTLVDRAPVKREFPDREAPLLALMWPYLLAGALLATFVVRYHSLAAGEDETLLLDALLTIGAVVFLRQVLMIHRNRIHVESQRSELVASVSHELRTPLTAMVGYLTLLDEEGDDFPEEARIEMISAATDQARHIARLVSDLVMLARGNQRQVPLEITRSYASSIITDALRGVETGTTRIEEDLPLDPPIAVDNDRMRQAIGNLLNNAVRYGGDRILLEGRIVEDDFVIEVHDNGPGVPTRHESAIWERFERGAHRLDATTPGMGIGLAIVLAIAEAHGGKASYRRSEKLGGACFTMTIPGCVLHQEAESVTS